MSARILVVEDDATTAAEIARALTARGLCVDSVADGAEGFARAVAGAYDAITLDRMVGWTGWRWRRRCGTRATTPRS